MQTIPQRVDPGLVQFVEGLVHEITVSGRKLVLGARIDHTASDARVVFTGGQHGEHGIWLSVSSPARIQAHWEGYCEAQVPAETKRPSKALQQYVTQPTQKNWDQLVASCDTLSPGMVFHPQQYVTFHNMVFRLEWAPRGLRVRRFNRKQRAFNSGASSLEGLKTRLKKLEKALA